MGRCRKHHLLIHKLTLRFRVHYLHVNCATSVPCKDVVLPPYLRQPFLSSYAHQKCYLGPQNFHVLLSHYDIHVLSNFGSHGLVKFHEER